VGTFLTYWLEHVKVGPTTRPAYRQKLTLHVIPTLGHLRLDRLTVQHVNELLNDKAKTLSPQSVHHIRAVLRGALNDAVRWGEIGRNVAELADPPRVEQFEPMFLSIEQARAFMTAADNDRLAALYRVAVPLGLRQGEALGLRWEDVDLNDRTLHVRRSLKRIKGAGLVNSETKTRRSKRDLPLPEVAIRSLRAHKARQATERLAAGTAWIDNGLVFTTLEGRPISATHLVNASFHRICDAAGIPFSTDDRHGLRFHDLRHSAATLLMAMGVQDRVVMEILGHTSLATTSRYMHVPDALKREAIRRMDAALAEGS
jgi:integrase